MNASSVNNISIVKPINEEFQLMVYETERRGFKFLVKYSIVAKILIAGIFWAEGKTLTDCIENAIKGAKFKYQRESEIRGEERVD